MFHAALRRCALVLVSTLVLLAIPATANAAAKTWDGGGGDGLWNTPANWNGDAVPSGGDTVDLAGATVTLDTGASPSSISNGSLVVSGVGQLVGAVAFSGTQLGLNTSTALDGTGALTVSAGSTVVQNASMTVTGARDLNVDGSWVIRGAGTVLEDDASADMVIGSSGSLVGEPNQAATVHSYITLTSSGVVEARDADGAGATFTSGTFEVRTETGVANANAGFDADAGYMLRLTMGSWTWTDVDVTGNGVVQVDTSASPGATYTATGTTQVDGTLRLAGGTFAGTQTLQGGGTLEWTGGTLGAPNTTFTIAPGFDVNVTGGAGGDQVTIENQGSWTFGPGTIDDDPATGVTFNNQLGGTFGTSIEGTAIVGFNHFDNDGEVYATGDGVGTPTVLSVPTIDNGGGTETGTFRAAGTDASVQLSLGARIWSGVTVSGSGQVAIDKNFTSGLTPTRVTASGTTTVDGTLQLVEGEFQGTSAMTGIGSFDWSGGTLGNSGSTLTLVDGFDLRVFGNVASADNFVVDATGDITMGPGAVWNDPGACATMTNSTALVLRAGGELRHADASVANLGVNHFKNEGLVTVTAGGLTVDTCNATTGGDNVETGTWHAQGATSFVQIVRGERTWDGVDVTGTGEIRINGASAATTITLDSADAVTVTGTLVQSGNTTFNAPAGGGTINGAGTFALAGGAWAGSGVITIAADAHVDVRSSVDWTIANVVNRGDWSFSPAGGSVLVNDSGPSVTFQNASTGTVRSATAGWGGMGFNGFYNDGTVEAGVGTLRVATWLAGKSNPGDFIARDGAVLEFDCGTWQLASTTSFMTEGTGSITASEIWCPNVIDFGGNDLVISGTLKVVGGPELVGSTEIASGTLELAGDVLNSAGVLTVDTDATLRFSSGVSIPGSRSIVNDGTVEIAGAHTIEDESGNVSFTNNGTLMHTGGGPACQCLNHFVNADGGTIRNESSTFRAATERPAGGQEGGGTFIANNGSTLELPCGTWHLDGASSFAGTGYVETNGLCGGGVVDIDGSSDADPIDTTGSITIRRNGGGSFTGDGAFAGSGTLELGTSTFGAGTLTTAAPFRVLVPSGANVNLGSRALVNGGTLELQNDADLTHAGTLASTGIITKTGVGDSVLTGVVDNDGTVRTLDGDLHLASAPTNLTGTTLTGGTWEIAGGDLHLETLQDGDLHELDATLDLQAGAGVLRAMSDIGNAVSSITDISADGSLTIQGTRSQALSFTVDSAGDITVTDTATLDAPAGIMHSGAAPATTLRDTGASLVASSVEIPVGTFHGRGVVVGNVTQTGGVIRPGYNDRGTLTVQGDFTQTAGILWTEVAGVTPGAFDVLDVTGATTLDGTVVLDTSLYTAPAHATSIDVVTSASGDDSEPTYAPVNLRFGTDEHWQFIPFYADGNLTLETDDDTPPTLPSAFDSDSHDVSVPSNDVTVDLEWTGSTDAGTGLSGYSTSFTTSATDPTLDETIDHSAGLTTKTVSATQGAVDQEWWFHIRAIDVAGNASAIVDYGPFRIDTDPPEATLDLDQVAAFTNDPTPTFAFGSNEPGSTFECSTDGGTVWDDCTSPETTGAYAEGARTFGVRATDSAGNTGTPVTDSFTVDTTAPGGTFSGGPTPGAWINVNDGTFAFTNSDASGTQTATCRFDAAPFGACTAALEHDFTDLADGAHTIDVKLADAAGNESTISRAFNIDTVVPTPTFTAPVLAYTGAATELFEWTLPAGGSTVSAMCTLNGGATVPCDSSTSELVATSGEAIYTLVVQTTDQAGNTATASRSVTKDETDPSATLDTPTNLVNAYWTGSALIVGANSAGSFTLNVTATDLVSLVKQVELEDLYTGGGTDAWTPSGVGIDTTGVSDVFSIPYSWTAGALLDATSPFQVTVTDNAGNTNTNLLLPIQVAAAPGHGLVIYAADTTDADGTVEVTWSAGTDGSGTGLASSKLIRQQAALAADGSCPFAGSGSWGTDTEIVGVSPVTDSNPPVDACVRYLVRTIDNVGGMTDTHDGQFDVIRVDASGPTFTVDTPGDGVATKDPVELAGTTDDSTDVTSITAAVDGPDADTTSDATGAPTNCIVMGPAVWTCDPWSPEAGDGTYTLTFTATDGVGNTTNVEHHVVWDTAGPTVAFASFTEGTNPLFQHVAGSRLWFNPAQSGSFTATLTASDPNNVMDATFADPDGAGASLWTTADGTIGSAPWRTTYTWAAGAVDPTDATVVFRDDAANSSAAVTLDIEPDATVPTGSVSAPAGDLTGSVSVTGAAADTHSGLRSVVVTYGGAASGAVCTVTSGFGAWSCTWDTTSLASGSYTLTATTTDNVGNVATATATATVAHPVVTPPADPTPPAPTPPAPTPDTTPPALTPKVAKTVPWATAVKNVLGSIVVNEQSSVTLKLFVQPKDAKRLGLGVQRKPFLIGTATVKGNGTVKFKLVPNKKGKGALGKLKAGASVVLVLEATAVDAAKNKVVKKANVTIKRPAARR